MVSVRNHNGGGVLRMVGEGHFESVRAVSALSLRLRILSPGMRDRPRLDEAGFAAPS